MTRTWKGTLRRGLPGLGGWKLEGRMGRRWLLVGSVPPQLEGRRVEVRGQSGPLGKIAGVIHVEEIRPLKGTLGEP
jgi:hypothetical protein